MRGFGYMGDSFGSVVRTNYGAMNAARVAPRATAARASSWCPPGSHYIAPNQFGPGGCQRDLAVTPPSCPPGQIYTGMAPPYGPCMHSANVSGFGYLGDFGLSDPTATDTSGWATYSSPPPPPDVVSVTGGADSAPGDNLAMGTSSAFAQATGAGSSSVSGSSGGSGINWTNVITGAEGAVSSIVGAAIGTKAGSSGTGAAGTGGGIGGNSSTSSAVGTMAMVGLGLGALFLLLK